MKLITKATFLFVISIVVFNGCKKTAVNETKEQTDLVEFYKQKLKNEPLVSTQILNLKGKGYYGDINGNRITVIPGQSNRTEASTCPDPGESEFDQEFVSMDREYTCGVGYRFLVTYKITSEFYPVLSSGSNFSVGRVRLKNGSTTIYTTPTAHLLSIVNNGIVGTNSNGDDLNEFIIEYRTDIVSETVYNNSTAIQPNLFAYTDCTNYPTLTIGFSTQQSAVGSQHTTQPCLRVDKVYWSPSAGTPPNYTPPSLSGADPTGSGCFPYGYVFPDKQEIHFKKTALDVNYTGTFNLYINGLNHASVATSLINYWDVWYIDPTNSVGLVTGNVEVRYRNNHMNGSGNGAPCVTQPDDTWVYETWYIN